VGTKHTSRDGLRKKLGALAISVTLLTACGSTGRALSDTGQNEQRSSVVRDPSNPYWTGSASTQSGDRPSLLHDPENPYWKSNAPTDTYADPVHGDR
jgi:hypothetical protein